MRVAFHTFGCKLNQLETEALAAAFRGRGFVVSTDSDEESAADLYILNSCTVTARSEQKLRMRIRHLLKRYATASFIVTGCAAQVEGERLQRISPRLVILPQAAKSGILSLAAGLAGTETGADLDREIQRLLSLSETSPVSDSAAASFVFRPTEYSFHTRAWVKIQDGCDNRCSYCRVPAARGPGISDAPQRILSQVEAITASGIKEIVLTGVHISSYGNVAEYGLPELLEDLLGLPGDFRIRLSSLEPEGITERLAELASNERICPHFHIPVQSGSDGILSRMRRRSSSVTIRNAVARLRAAKGDPFLAADIIVGFPGESDDDFGKTFDLVRDSGFAKLHVFPFSPRPGTEAAGMTDLVPTSVVKQRVRTLVEWSAAAGEAYIGRWEGKPLAFILERQDGEAWNALSENYIRARVNETGSGTLQRGDLVRCRFHRTELGLESFPIVFTSC